MPERTRRRTVSTPEGQLLQSELSCKRLTLTTNPRQTFHTVPPCRASCKSSSGALLRLSSAQAHCMKRRETYTFRRIRKCTRRVDRLYPRPNRHKLGETSCCTWAHQHRSRTVLERVYSRITSYHKDFVVLLCVRLLTNAVHCSILRIDLLLIHQCL